MGKVDLSNSENILIKVDQNNLIYIDPNSVVVDGEIEPRGVRPENLVMYINLEADIVPRSMLVATNDQNTLFSVAKGTLNFLQNQKGGDYDTSWTESFFERTEITKQTVDVNGKKIPVGTGEFFQSDGSAQSFGIDSVTITTKGINGIPEVKISFVDVRGKTLFESPENSPYKAFFHLPWPIFYLTIKGFYGKAVRYRLHMTKFSTRFNESNGNFEISTDFIGSTFAYLTDIPLNAMLNTPYMFRNEVEKPAQFNEGTGRFEKKISKSSRGYAILTSIFNEYKQKRLIDRNFPVKTLRELIVISETLDVLLENEIFQKVDFKIFAGMVEYEKTLSNLGLYIENWTKKNLTTEFFTNNTGTTVNPLLGPPKNEFFFYLKGTNRTDTSKLLGISDKEQTLEKGLENYKKILNENKIFANNLINKSTIDFSKLRISNFIRGIKDYIGYTDGQKVGVNIDLLGEDFKTMVNEFLKQKDTLQKEVEEEINKIVRDPKKGIGFEPTIRNIFAVILANAEVYIRLLKDVHNKAFQDSENRSKILKSFSDETPGGGAIYPWPEVKKSSAIGSKSKLIAYPGDRDLRQKLKSDDKKLWPEVDFVEEYMAVGTNKYDPLTNKEGGVGKIDYIFESNLEESKIKKISTLDTLIYGFGKSLGTIPYTEKTLSSILYEIFERSFYTTTFDNFSIDSINELSEIEFENLQESIKEDYELIGILTSGVKSIRDLFDLMKATSPFERFPYLVDRLPTTPYLSGILDLPFKLEQYYNTDTAPNGQSKPINNNDVYVKLSENLLKYEAENYRLKIYPFNSNTYLSYINKGDFNSDELKFGTVLKMDTSNGFIASMIDPEKWIKTGFETNLFSYRFKLGNTNLPGFSAPILNYVNILNTPYFHKQLFTDFFKSGRQEKYVGSAYLLLNSLPFKDLEDIFTNNIRVSSLFREIGSTHFIPYHLLLKWGSIYHRYKRKILDNVDILNGFLTTSNITTPYSGPLFFDNNSGFTFTLDSTPITYSNNKDIGIHPFYDAIFHQIINGYNHYDVFSGSTSFDVNVIAGAIRGRKREQIDGTRYWTNFVDNSKFNPSDKRVTLLPCDGGNSFISPFKFSTKEQSNLRLIWEDDLLNYDINFSGLTFASHSEYPRTFVSNSRTYDNLFGIDSNYRKVVDLIATFSPKILEQFEEMFLEFSKETIKEELPYKRFDKVPYYYFQDILRDISTVKMDVSSNVYSGDTEAAVNEIKLRQQDNIKSIHLKLISKDNLISLTIANPKEIDPHVVGGFANLYSGNTFSYNEFSTAQIPANLKYIDLYLGEDMDNKYLQFFATNDIELSEDNVLQFRPLAQIFAGQYKNTPTPTKDNFINLISSQVLNVDRASTLTPRHERFLNNLILKISTLTPKIDGSRRVTPVNGIGDEILKLDLYNSFKTFNDRWIGGNSIGQRLLFEEFLFLDKANKDIGSDAYFNIQKLSPLDDPRNQKQNLYGVISLLIQGTGFDMRPLPSYINFYGANYSNKTKPMPSKKIANNLFGAFLEVDYQESSPKVILQYVGPTSKHLDLTKYSKDYRFIDDSFNIANTNNNPLIITAPAAFNNADLYKSNRVVAFEVSFGDQNQSIFKGVQLDQTSIKNTTESFIAMENLGRSESGSNSYQVDIGLFDIYRQSSYTCQVASMGNVMIQPTMYFYLKNVPMFKGTYWITDVVHTVRSNTISTVFTGTRIPYASLPDPKESTMATYRPLFDAIVNKALIKNNESDRGLLKNELSLTVQDGRTVTVDLSGKSFNGETLVHRSGVNIFGVPYNGFNNNNTSTGEKYIQLIQNNNFKAPDGNNEWLRALAVRMGGPIYELDDDMTMGLISNILNEPKPKPLLWSEIKDSNTYFYGTRFLLNVINADKIITANTEFLNPKNNKRITVLPSYDLTSTVKKAEGPVHVGPALPSYGIGLSSKLMKDLGLYDGDVVYFKLY